MSACSSQVWKACCMPKNQYPDVAAARHMRDTPGQSRPGSKVAKQVQAAPRKARVALPVTLQRDERYRKKRMVAFILSAIVCLAVPGLVALLVLFG